jgi:hypothetical protein
MNLITLDTWRAAEKAGADFIVVRTNGARFARRNFKKTSFARSRLKTRIGIHTHDIGLGANALAAAGWGHLHRELSTIAAKGPVTAT